MMRFRAAAALACTAALSSAQFSTLETRGLIEDRGLLKGAPAVVIFLSAKCPVSNAYGDRLQAIYNEYGPRGVRFLFVNSNSNETPEEIVRNSREHGFTFPIFHDKASRAAEQFGAQFTPEVFLLDREAATRYHGAIDDSQNPVRVKHRSLRESLDQLLRGEPVAVSETRAFGCTIKRPRKPVN